MNSADRPRSVLPVPDRKHIGGTITWSHQKRGSASDRPPVTAPAAKAGPAAAAAAAVGLVLWTGLRRVS
jgi:hypothetical protein